MVFSLVGNDLKNRRNAAITNAKKKKRGLKKVFKHTTLYIELALRVLEWFSMTFLASFLKTESDGKLLPLCDNLVDECVAQV